MEGMRRLLLLTPALLALACSGDDGASTTASTSAAATTSTSGDATGSGTTSASTTGTGTAATTGTGTGATTGLELCHFGTTGDSTGGDAPWLELYHLGEPLLDGGVLHLVCGGQGIFMFEVTPFLGGFMPTEDYVHFEVALDIEGHNDGPEGHFYAATPYDILVGCVEDYYDFGGATSFQMVVFDEIANLTDLDGLPGHLHVGYSADGMSVEIDLDLTINTMPSEDWLFCGYEDTTGGTTDGTTGTSTGTTGP